MLLLYFGFKTQNISISIFFVISLIVCYTVVYNYIFFSPLLEAHKVINELQNCCS